MSPLTVLDLLNVLEHEPLLSAPARAELKMLAGEFPEIQALVRQLVQRGWLTTWQANELVLGRGQQLVLGRYVLLERLGRGGMGEVFKARHTTLGRIDAVKVIHPKCLDHRDAVQRFLREARGASRLRHPHLVAVYDAGDAAGRHFLAMEYVAGIDLEKRVRRQGPLPWPQVCAIVHQAALGLQHVYEKGLVHRDLKPSNLLQCEETGQIKILDLGLVHFLTDESETTLCKLTPDGMILGTPDYMAPEQCSDSKVDIRADLYSLGCTAYHLLAGHAPFPGGKIVEKLLRHRTEPPRSLEQLRPDVPAALEQIVRRLLAKEPAARFQTPEQLAGALQPLLGGEAFAGSLTDRGAPMDAAHTAAAGAPTLPESVRATAVPNAMPISGLPALNAGLKRPVLPGSRLAVGAGLAIGVFVMLLFAIWLVPALFQPAEFDSNTKGAGGGKPTAQPRRWQAGPVLRPTGQQVFGVAFSQDGRWLAAACGNYDLPHSAGQIRLFDRKKAQWQTLGEHRFSPRHLVFTPDSRMLISATGFVGPGMRGKGDVTFWDMAILKERRLLKDVLTGSIDAMALEPQGKWFVVAGRGPELRWLNVADGRNLGPLKSQRNNTYCALAVSNDGRQTAIGYGDGVVEVYANWKRQAQFLVKPDERTGVAGLAFRPGDAELVGVATVVADLGKPAVIKVWDLGKEKLKCPSLEHGWRFVFCTALSPDGRTLATGDQEGYVRFWDVEKQQLLNEFKHHLEAVWAIAFSHDGRLLASGGNDGTVRLWHGR